MDKLLRKLGISKDLSCDEIIEKLKEANTEHLERMENCRDPKRLADLQFMQEQIEQVLHGLSTGMISIPKAAAPAAKPATASVDTAKPQTAAPNSQKKIVSTPKDLYAEAFETMRNGDYAGTQPKGNRLENKLRRESKDQKERSMPKDAKRIYRPGIRKARFSINPAKIFNGIKLLFLLAVFGFMLYLAGAFVHYVVIGWMQPAETEGGYAVYITDKDAVKIPSKYFFSPVVYASTTDTRKIYVPESLEELSMTIFTRNIDFVTAAGSKPTMSGIAVPETLKKLRVRYSNSLNKQKEHQSLSFNFSRAKALEKLSVEGIIMSGTFNLSELPLLSSIEFRNVKVNDALTLPANTNVDFHAGESSYIAKLIIAENADILAITAAVGYSNSAIGWIEFSEAARTGALHASITEMEDIIIPEKAVFDEISLMNCSKTKLIEIGNGVKDASIYDNNVLEELIVKGENLRLHVRDNPNLVRLEILSECNEVYVSGNTALETITIHTSDPSKLTIRGSEDQPNAVTLLRVPPDCVDVYTAHFADIFPDMRIAGIKE